MSWLDPVRQALDEGPCTAFFRDDDAGWGDERLWVLLDLFDRRSLPVDLAVIPAELHPRLTAVHRFHGGVKTGWTSSPNASRRMAAPWVMSPAWAAYDRARPNSHLRPVGSWLKCAKPC